MYCPKCGQENPAEARFCGKCAAPMPTTLSQPEGIKTGTGKEAVSKGLKIGIIIATIFFPLIGIIMGAIYMSDPSPEKKSVARTWLYIGIGMGILWFLYYLGEF